MVKIKNFIVVMFNSYYEDNALIYPAVMTPIEFMDKIINDKTRIWLHPYQINLLKEIEKFINKYDSYQEIEVHDIYKSYRVVKDNVSNTWISIKRGEDWVKHMVSITIETDNGDILWIPLSKTVEIIEEGIQLY